MCNFNILVQNNHGYIVYCPGCRIFQLAYGTTLTRLQTNDFSLLRQYVATECSYRNESGRCIAKNITVPIDEATMFCLTNSELFKLDQLLAEAAAVFDTYRILEQV